MLYRSSPLLSMGISFLWKKNQRWMKLNKRKMESALFLSTPNCPNVMVWSKILPHIDTAYCSFPLLFWMMTSYRCNFANILTNSQKELSHSVNLTHIHRWVKGYDVRSTLIDSRICQAEEISKESVERRGEKGLPIALGGYSVEH